MDARIGFDRASIATNALINTNKEVGRAREHLIFAPARARCDVRRRTGARDFERARRARVARIQRVVVDEQSLLQGRIGFNGDE